jgi:hypothetical protein
MIQILNLSPVDFGLNRLEIVIPFGKFCWS